MATSSQVEAFQALVHAAVRYPKTLDLPFVECDGIKLSPEDLCALLERDSEKMSDQLVAMLQALGCVGVAAGKSSFAVGVRKIRDLLKRQALSQQKQAPAGAL